MDPEQLRVRAQRYRAMAAQGGVNDPKAVDALLELAAEYERRAEEMERTWPSEPRDPPDAQ